MLLNINVLKDRRQWGLEPRKVKVGLMTGTLFLMGGGLMMSKLRILDDPQSWNFDLVGNWVWREIQIIDVICQNYNHYMDYLLVSFLWGMASNIVQGTPLTALALFSTIEYWYFLNFWQVPFVILISCQTQMPTRLKFQVRGAYAILNSLIMRPPHIKIRCQSCSFRILRRMSFSNPLLPIPTFLVSRNTQR